MKPRFPGNEKIIEMSVATAAARPHDALLAHIGTTDELAVRIRAELTTKGYAVVPAVFTREECAAHLDLLWQYVEALNPKVRRDDRDSWYPRPRQRGTANGKGRQEGEDHTADDPWPHTGWKSFSDML